MQHMIKKIDHIGIVVKDLDSSVKQYQTGLGLEYLRTEENKPFNCRIAFLQCGDVLIELIEPTGEGPSMQFLQDHGEGIHHICYEVDDIYEALEHAKANLKTEYLEPKSGAGDSKVFFLDSSSVCGVETEFVELKK